MSYKTFSGPPSLPSYSRRAKQPVVDSEEPPAETHPKLRTVFGIIVGIIVGYLGYRCHFTDNLTSDTSNPFEEEPSLRPAVPPAPVISRARSEVCNGVWRLHEFYGSSNGRSTPKQRPEYLELFEYLGLNVFAAPFHPHSDMTLPGRPNYSASRAAIKDGWAERLKGFGADSSNPCNEECKAENVDNVKEAILTGYAGGTVEEEILTDVVADLIYNDDTRLEYVTHVLPVLKPEPQKFLGWNLSPGDLNSVCPKRHQVA